jgi:HEAT repeat protein
VRRKLVIGAVLAVAITAIAVPVRCNSGPDVAALEKKRDVSGLIDAVQRDDTRLPAAEALGRIKDRRAVVPLVRLLNDVDGLESHRARDAVVTALGEIEDRRAVVPLTRLLSSPKTYRWEKRSVLHALAQIGDSRSVATLLGSGSREDRAFLTKELLLMGKKIASQLAAFLAGKLVLPTPLRAIEREKARMSAASALGRLGNRRAISRATAALTARLRADSKKMGFSGSVRREIAALEAVERDSDLLALVNRSDVRPLFPLLYHRDTYYVYWGLMRLGKRGSEADLVRAFRELTITRDENLDQQSWAQDYLSSGDKKLEAAAEEWASHNGLVVISSIPTPSFGEGGGGSWGTLK